MHSLLFLMGLCAALPSCTPQVTIPLRRCTAHSTSSNSISERNASTSPLTNFGDDAYLGIVNIGTPPQPLLLQFDTGSSDVSISSDRAPLQLLRNSKLAPFLLVPPAYPALFPRTLPFLCWGCPHSIFAPLLADSHQLWFFSSETTFPLGAPTHRTFNTASSVTWENQNAAVELDYGSGTQ
jgi:hypothetical protein